MQHLVTTDCGFVALALAGILITGVVGIVCSLN